MGTDKQRAFDDTAAAAEQLSTELRYLHHPDEGPATDWTASDLDLGAQHRWSQDGDRLPDEHYASIRISAEFADFAELNRFTGAIAQVDGGSIDGTRWSITEASTTAAEREARAGAVRDARDRAQVYADALDLGAVRALSVAEPGLLRSPAASALGGTPVSADADEGGIMPVAPAGPPAPTTHIEQTPEGINVTAAVEARFVAGPAA